MNKKEFLDILYEQLSGQMPEGNVAAHVQYYRNYIEEEQRKGRSEDDILNELGDPHLIARTLLDTEAAASGNPQTTEYYSESYNGHSSGYNGYENFDSVCSTISDDEYDTGISGDEDVRTGNRYKKRRDSKRNPKYQMAGKNAGGRRKYLF